MISGFKWKRRSLLGFAVLSTVASFTGRGHTQEEPGVTIARLSDRIAEPRTREGIFADVSLIHSWRAQLAPRGYENEGDWYAAASSFTLNVLRDITQQPELVSVNRDRYFEVAEFGARANVENANAFARFLQDIGIEPVGPAGRRIVESMRDFYALGAVARPAEAETARRRSFFWPLC